MFPEAVYFASFGAAPWKSKGPNHTNYLCTIEKILSWLNKIILLHFKQSEIEIYVMHTKTGAISTILIYLMQQRWTIKSPLEVMWHLLLLCCLFWTLILSEMLVCDTNPMFLLNHAFWRLVLLDWLQRPDLDKHLHLVPSWCFFCNSSAAAGGSICPAVCTWSHDAQDHTALKLTVVCH